MLASVVISAWFDSRSRNSAEYGTVMPVSSGGALRLARVDRQQIAARLVGRELGDVAARGFLAELHVDRCSISGPLPAPLMFRKFRNSSFLSSAVTTTRTLPSFTSVAMVNLPSSFTGRIAQRIIWLKNLS